MKSKKWIATIAVAAGASGAALCAGNVWATGASPTLQTTILAQATFPQLLLSAKSQPAKLWRAKLKTHGVSDFYVVDNKFSPGDTTGWHTHLGPSVIFVVNGTVTNYMSDAPGCQGQTYSKGSGFVDPGGSDTHMIRNESGAPAETIAVQFLPTGAPRKIDEPAPPGCPS